MDAFSPKEIAERTETIGVKKARMDFFSLFVLAVVAGAFVALGACFYTTAMTGSSAGLGFTRIIGGLSFCLGLILILVAGAELFTGNTLIIMATISGKVSIWQLLRNWAIVYAGNFVGSIATAAIIYAAAQWKLGDMTVGQTAYMIAGKKLSMSFTTAFASGILCNGLVCLGVWLCYGARSVADKIIAIIFPITAFVTLGFEHSVANMFFIPYAMALTKTPEFMSNPIMAEALHKFSPSIFTTQNFLLANLLPVTLGNIVGGSVMVGCVYWMVYLRDNTSAPMEPAESIVEQYEEISNK